MIYLIEKSNILEKLANILFNSVDQKYEKLHCNYKSIHGTISTSISYETNSERVSIEAPVGVASKNLELCLELRELMKNHTGGEWDSFTLTLDADGKAHTKFHYPDVAS